MRLAILLLTFVASSAAAVEPWKYPDQTNHMGWLTFCEGMEHEVARQATTTDNHTLYEHSTGSEQALAAEIIVTATTAPTSYSPAESTYWQGQGAGVAGNEFWDSAPLFDNQFKTGAEMRNEIVAFRSKTLQGCDALAGQSATYETQAQKILKGIPSTRKRRP